MRDDPRIDVELLARCLRSNYGIHVIDLTFLPIGYDLNAFAYRAVDKLGTAHFVKIRSTPLFEPGLQVPGTLIELGVSQVLAPIRTVDSKLWSSLDGLDGYSVVLYPFIEGDNAVSAGLSDEQWREFGVALREVHDSRLEQYLGSQLRTENFDLPSAALVRRMLETDTRSDIVSPSRTKFATFWLDNSAFIRELLTKVEALGNALRSRSFELVLCHGDIHAANILTGTDGRIWMIDWDGPLIAPRERDLLFVIGSQIARRVEPGEEMLFFAGYGAYEIDPDALAFFRYERIIEDIGEFAKSVLLDPNLSEEFREQEAALAMRLFKPGHDIDRAESLPRTRWLANPR